MSASLTRKLVIVLTVGLLLAFLGQLAVRYFFELPVLYRLEAHADAKNVERVRRALQERATTLGASAVDYSAWDDTYEIMQLAPGDRKFDQFIVNNLDPATLKNLDVQGAVLLDRQAQTKYGTATDGGETLQIRSLNTSSLVETAVTDDSPLINTGISHSNLGMVLFAASSVVTAFPPYPEPTGTLVFWRRLDAGFFARLQSRVQMQLNFIAIDEALETPALAERVARLQDNDGDFLPRDQNSRIYWLLSDINGHPVYLVEQQAEQRAFSSALVSRSVQIGFFLSSAILLLLAWYFSRTVIRRLLGAGQTMTEIVADEAYDNRLPTVGADEITTMFRQFNALLEHIQNQNQELKQHNRVLATLSQQDALTGIANRRYLDEVLDRNWRQCARSKRALSVLMIDIDCFKEFNDRYGHQAGDTVLRQVAQALQNNLHRATDDLARYGGEEFCIVLTDTTTENAISVAERLRAAVEALHIATEGSSCSPYVTISIGIASATPDARIVQLDLVRAADKALYEAKRGGRNRVRVHAGNDDESAVIRS